MKHMKRHIGQYIYLAIICMILCGMVIHVSYTKEKLEDLKSQLEEKEIERRRKGIIYDKSHGLTSYGVHVEGAYLMAIPYLIVDFALVLVYIVRYHT